ncbi:MAG TPA: hypothetical protein VG099_12215 [Gemmataceae bacterium]|nr:hypothetical protein [Gemmataceae bacterium]
MIATDDAPETTNGRDTHGKFAKGNAGGPGNPFARQVGRLRKVLLDCVTEEDMAAIGVKLIELARDDNVQAIKLLFSYTLGKPAPAVQPDQLDAEEWDLFKETADMAKELPEMVVTPDASFPLTVARAARGGVASDLGKQLLTKLHDEEEQDRKREKRRHEDKGRQRDRNRPVKPSPNGKNGVHQRTSETPPEIANALKPLAELDNLALCLTVASTTKDQAAAEALASSSNTASACRSRRNSSA